MKPFNKYLHAEFTEGYDQTIDKYVVNYDQMLKSIFKELPDEDKNLLEMGCGSGNLISHLDEKRNLKITGIDISEKLIKYAIEKNSKHPHLDFIVGDILEIELGNVKFDYIVSSLFVHELYPFQREKLMEKIKAWSKKTTQIIIGDFFNIENPSEREKCINEWYTWMINRGINNVDALKEIDVHIRDSIYVPSYLTNLLKKIGFGRSELIWSCNLYKVMIFSQ